MNLFYYTKHERSWAPLNIIKQGWSDFLVCGPNFKLNNSFRFANFEYLQRNFFLTFLSHNVIFGAKSEHSKLETILIQSGIFSIDKKGMGS